MPPPVLLNLVCNQRGIVRGWEGFFDPEQMSHRVELSACIISLLVHWVVGWARLVACQIRNLILLCTLSIEHKALYMVEVNDGKSHLWYFPSLQEGEPVYYGCCGCSVRTLSHPLIWPSQRSPRTASTCSYLPSDFPIMSDHLRVTEVNYISMLAKRIGLFICEMKSS